MKNNLLAQNDDLVIENLKADVGKSVMNLSHSVTFPIDVDGAILPICCIETVPSDSFEISVECLLRQLSSLKVPLMTNFRLNTAFYYCDNRLAWKKWDRFMTGGRSGNEVYEIPRCANARATKSSYPTKYELVDISPTSGSQRNIKYSNSLHTYFGVCMNVVHETWPSYDETVDYSAELPVAFPFFDYQLIKRDFYTNIDRLPQNAVTADFYDFDNLNSDWAYNNLFPQDDDEIRLIDGPQLKSGFVSEDDTSGTINNPRGFCLDKVRYHDVRPDYFSSSKAAPMRGSAPKLSASSKFVLKDGTEFSLTNLTFKDVNGFAAELPLKVNFSSSGGSTKVDTFVDTNSPNVRIQNTPTVVPGQPVTLVDDIATAEGLVNQDVTLEGVLQSDWTAADIRLLSQLTVWQELNMLHEPYYNDFLNAHFDNVRVGESSVEKPQYIGGTSQIISINEILQTSASSGESYLGNQGATAMSLASNFVGRYYCNNYGYIIGVAYIIPELMYKPAMPRHFSRRTKEEYYSPEFANLSMQATLNKEIFFSNDDDWNNMPWGYTGAFDELRSIPNRIAGDLLNPSYTDLNKWVLTREMANDNLPAMESTWLSLKGNVDKSAWNVQDMPAFMLQVANIIKAVRPMPKVAIPKAL